MSPVSVIFAAPWLLVHATLPDGDGYYELLDREGERLAVVHRDDVQAVDTRSRKARLWSGSASVAITSTLRVSEPGDATLLSIVSEGPERKWHAVVSDGEGTVVGEIVKARGVHKIQLGLLHDGASVAAVEATGWSGRDFRVRQGDVDIGRITGNPQGLPLEIDDTLYDHLLELDRPVAGPAATLLTACLTWMDLSLSLNQKE